MNIPSAVLSIKKNAKIIGDFFANNFTEIVFWIILILLLFLFWGFVDYRLVNGGIILWMIGIKQYILPGIGEQNASRLLIGSILILTGTLAIFTKNIMAIGGDAMVLVMLVIVTGVVGLYFLMENFLAKKTKIISIPTLLIMTIVLMFTIGPLINAINSNGFSNFYFYLATINFIILINFGLFILIRELLSLYGIKNNSLSLGVAVSIFVVVSGYFYLGIVPKELKLERFLIIVSIGFVTVWGAIASFRNIFNWR